MICMLCRGTGAVDGVRVHEVWRLGGIAAIERPVLGHRPKSQAD